MYVTKPYKFIGFGAMDVTKPYKFIGCGEGSRSGLLALPPKAARTKNNVSLEKVWFVWALVPQASKTHWAKNTLRDPFENIGRTSAGPN